MRTLVFGIVFFEFMMLTVLIVQLMDKPGDKGRLWLPVLPLFMFLHDLCRLRLPDTLLPVHKVFQLDIFAVITGMMCVYMRRQRRKLYGDYQKTYLEYFGKLNIDSKSDVIRKPIH